MPLLLVLAAIIGGTGWWRQSQLDRMALPMAVAAVFPAAVLCGRLFARSPMGRSRIAGLLHALAHVTQAAPGGAALTVADTGEGIAAADLPFVFDRFWRGDRARGRSAGAGLGLAIARQLVLAHGGAIDVQSAPGEGTIFTIRLPTP